MPTYEYRCPNGHDFEKFFRTISTSEMSVVCPTCGEMGQRHLSVGAGLVFKGSGFYLTDYGKNAHANRGDAKPSAPAEGSGNSESSTAAKPATDSGATSAAQSDSGKSAGKSAGKSTDTSTGKSSGKSTGAASTDAKPAPKKND